MSMQICIQCRQPPCTLLKLLWRPHRKLLWRPGFLDGPSLYLTFGGFTATCIQCHAWHTSKCVAWWNSSAFCPRPGFSQLQCQACFLLPPPAMHVHILGNFCQPCMAMCMGARIPVDTSAGPQPSLQGRLSP